LCTLNTKEGLAAMPDLFFNLYNHYNLSALYAKERFAAVLFFNLYNHYNLIALHAKEGLAA